MRIAGAHTRPWVAGALGLSAVLSCSPEYLVDWEGRRVVGDSQTDDGARLGLSIRSVDPATGPAGAGPAAPAPRVTVRGTDFDQSVRVYLAGNQACAPMELISPTEITCYAPQNEVAGPVPVTVERGGEKKTLSYPFRYYYPDATFSAPRWKATEPRKPALVLAQDMNEDGYPDVVIGKESGAELTVFLLSPPSTRDGMITSASGATYLAGPDRIARDQTTAHLFRNLGFHRSVVYAFDQEVEVYSPQTKNQPLGNAAAGIITFSLPERCPMRGCRVAGVKLPTATNSAGDGVVVSEVDRLSLYYWLNTTPPMLQGQVIGELKTDKGAPFEVLSITAADFTGDGKLDLAVSGTNNQLMLYQGIDALPYFKFLESYPARPNTHALLSAYLNLDGRVDLVGLSTDMSNSLLPYFGGAMNLEPSALVTQLGGMTALGFAAGDWNGDGYPDIAFVDNSFGTAGKYGLAAGSGVRAAGVPVFGKPTLPALPGFHPSIAMADFNRDGLADLLIPDYDNDSVSIYVNTSGPPPRK